MIDAAQDEIRETLLRRQAALIRCPACGAVARLCTALGIAPFGMHDNGGEDPPVRRYRAKCNGDCIQTPYLEDLEQAIAMWNERRA